MARKVILITVLILNFSIMNAQEYFFPFGSKLTNVVQLDTTPKKVFVLGVYASAVHAQWKDKNGKELVKALAVASEPCIFWRGDSCEAQEIINRIKLPEKYGKLYPADSLNGPSGKSLDENYLLPLKFTRDEAWLCDLVPHSCINASQDSALKRVYDKIDELPKYSIPDLPKILATRERLNEILIELEKSQADTIILLGDQPIKYFLSQYSDYTKLSNFKEYGKPLKITINTKSYTVYPLAHPRQVSKLGRSNSKWYDKHQEWLRSLKL